MKARRSAKLQRIIAMQHCAFQCLRHPLPRATPVFLA
jgi:hypothetical protein